MTPHDRALFWFRRDLRDQDNAGLFHALKAARQVHCTFVFDREILDALPSRDDRRVAFIHASLADKYEHCTIAIVQMNTVFQWYSNQEIK